MEHPHDGHGHGHEPEPPDAVDEAKVLAAAVVAAGGSYAQAGDAAGKSKRTIVRWAADPAFARLVSDLRAERLSEVTGRLGETMPRALDTLIDCLDAESPFARIRAATAILEWTLRYRRASDLEARMLEVERRQGIRTASDADPDAESAAEGSGEGDGHGEMA